MPATQPATGRGPIASFALILAFAPIIVTCADDVGSLDGLAVEALLARAHALAAAKDQRHDDARLYSEVSFAATHNSYSGPITGSELGSIPAQLDRGVRLLELDVHDDAYEQFGYRIGHSDVGDEVFHGDGNPAGNSARDWLAMIADWSDAHRDHAPITLLIDLKDSLADNVSFSAGELGALNEELRRAFGKKLFPAAAVEASGWPTIAELRGRILTVLSGNERSRIAYRGDRGAHPAVAINERGQVIEVHDSGDGVLWYWTGVYSNGRIEWRRHSRYDTGQSPAVDLNNDGLVVEVHEAPDVNDYHLWYRVGRLGEDLEIEWYHEGGLSFPNGDDGLNPSLSFADRNSNRVREVHQSPVDGQHWYWDGAFQEASSSIAWSRDPRDGGETSERLFPKRSAVVSGHTIQVRTGEDRGFGADTLLYQVDQLKPERIRHPQLAFVEFQHGSPPELTDDGLFFCAGPASRAAVRSWAIARRAAGQIARLWEFNGSTLTREASVSFPATDLPFSKWYGEYCKILGCVR